MYIVARMWHKINLKLSWTGFNSASLWPVVISKLKSLPNYLPIAGGKIVGRVPFPKVSGLCEMQTASCKIWTRVAVSIYYDDGHHATNPNNTQEK